jgi:hypothetical protein
MNKFEKKYYEQLLGRKIVQMCVSPSDDGDFPGFILDNGKTVWVQRDPEGNGPGFLAIEEPNDDPKGE